MFSLFIFKCKTKIICIGLCSCFGWIDSWSQRWQLNGGHWNAKQLINNISKELHIFRCRNCYEGGKWGGFGDELRLNVSCLNEKMVRRLLQAFCGKPSRAFWLFLSSPDVQPVGRCAPVRPPAVCLHPYSHCPPTFVLSGAVAQHPSVSDSMLTTLQKAPKKRVGLAVIFPISLRRTRSWTQLMANNYQGNFRVTASGDFIRREEGGGPLWSAAVTITLKSAPLLPDFSNWLAAGLLGNLYLSICEKQR